MKTLKNNLIVLSLSLVTVLSFGMTGCGSDDGDHSDDVVNTFIDGIVTSLDIEQHVSREACDQKAAVVENYTQSYITYDVKYSEDTVECSYYGISESSPADSGELKNTCFTYDIGGGYNGSCVTKATAKITDIQAHNQDNSPSRLLK